MARIRSVKPEFWTDSALGECSVSARLLFIGTWSFADDHGNLERSAKQLKAQVYPYDSVDCEPLLLELIHAGLLVEYSANEGKKYLHIKGFNDHQRIENPSKARFPPYASPQRALNEPSVSPRSSSSGSGGEGRGRESKNSHTHPRAREVEPTPTALRSASPPPEPSLGATTSPTAPLTEQHRQRWWAELKAAYPPFAGRQDWVSAEHHATHVVDEGLADWPALLAGVQRYAAYCKAGGASDRRYVMTPAKFFGAADRPYSQPWPLPEHGGGGTNGTGSLASIARAKAAKGIRLTFDESNAITQEEIAKSIASGEFDPGPDFCNVK